MDQFTLKAMRKELSEFGIVKITQRCGNEDLKRASIYAIFKYKGNFFSSFIYFLKSFKEVTPEELIKEVKKETEWTKRDVDVFLKREELYNKQKGYEAKSISFFITNEISSLCDGLRINYAYKTLEDKYSEDEVYKMLKNSTSPIEIFKRAKDEFIQDSTAIEKKIEAVMEI